MELWEILELLLQLMYLNKNTRTKRYKHINPDLWKIQWLHAEKQVKKKIVKLVFAVIYQNFSSALNTAVERNEPLRHLRSSDREVATRVLGHVVGESGEDLLTWLTRGFEIACRKRFGSVI